LQREDVTVLRPVVDTVKTAFIFYLCFAVLLIAVTLWLPQSRTVFSPRNQKGAAVASTSSDLIRRQREYKKSWRRILINEGYIPQAVYKSQTESLMGRRAGLEKVAWIHSENTIVLPKAANQSRLIGLVSKWRSLIQEYGFDVNSTRWGYSKTDLWVKLSSSTRVALANHFESLPLEQLTLIQPLTGFKGRLPGLIPVFPPEIKPLNQPPIKPEAVTVTPVPIFRKPAPEKPPHIQKHARVAIIIDDVGYVTAAADAMLTVPAPLTFSILPFGPYSRKYADAAKERGFEIILHLPLEPMDSKINPGPGLIKRDWTEEQIDNQLSADLEQVPWAIGINNHEGSAGTSDDRLMGILMKEIKRRQLFFVDSMTTAKSVAEKYARLNGLPFARRHVFIDNQKDLASKEAALRELIRIALRDGQAIGIAHVRENSADAIKEMLPEFVKAGIEIVPVSELVK
jgi:Uncharacterized protein conserved in bacteria